MKCKDCGSGNFEACAFCECGAPLFTPEQAALHYVKMNARDVRAAIRFAHEYEDKSHPDAFDKYLAALDVLFAANGS
jgi:hypothetical protein